MTKQEEILNKHVSLYFSSHHDKSRWNREGENGGAEWHTDKAIAEDIYKAMEEYSKQQCITFFEHLKRYASYGDNTPEQLYNLFIEQQNEGERLKNQY